MRGSGKEPRKGPRLRWRAQGDPAGTPGGRCRRARPSRSHYPTRPPIINLDAAVSGPQVPRDPQARRPHPAQRPEPARGCITQLRENMVQKGKSPHFDSPGSRLPLQRRKVQPTSGLYSGSGSWTVRRALTVSMPIKRAYALSARPHYTFPLVNTSPAPATVVWQVPIS